MVGGADREQMWQCDIGIRIGIDVINKRRRSFPAIFDAHAVARVTRIRRDRERERTRVPTRFTRRCLSTYTCMTERIGGARREGGRGGGGDGTRVCTRKRVTRAPMMGNAGKGGRRGRG